MSKEPIKIYTVTTIRGYNIFFLGVCLLDLETKDWIHYREPNGNILQFNKKNLISIQTGGTGIPSTDFKTRYEITTVNGTHTFTGKHLKERETANWHYYERDNGDIYHFRKEHMVSVKEVRKAE
jgi:hypothetical protein